MSPVEIAATIEKNEKGDPDFYAPPAPEPVGRGRIKSEFGRGYATALIQFANHRTMLAHWADIYGKMHEESPLLFTAAHTAEMWANGSSDHLYQLVRPRKGLSHASWRQAQGLAARALRIGHGFMAPPDSTPEECEQLLDTADHLLAEIGVTNFAEAIAWDTAHGLRPDPGDWSCPVMKVYPDETTAR